MTMALTGIPRLAECEPAADRLRTEVLEGLKQPRKRLACKWFYDQRGSQLFDEICQLPEYYPTRTEMGIMRDRAAAMAQRAGPRCQVIEYGSGNSAKTPLLLDALAQPAGYVPIDISREHLLHSAARIARRYPRLRVTPVCADYTADFSVPDPPRHTARRLIYFPGSTIGNFEPREARAFLRRMAGAAGPGGGVLIGVDRKKDPAVLHAAYNDARGVTAAFNLNVLARINTELGADFRLDRFSHYAFYNPVLGRIEMHLVSRISQTVTIDDTALFFAAGESIYTESSYKYNPEQFAALASDAGLALEEDWTDEQRFFSVMYLTVR